MSDFLFYALAGTILIPALAVVLSDNLFHAGLCMIVSFLGIAALYATLAAPFVAGMQVLVYAGAIAVLLLFAFMLTHDIMKPMEGSSKLQQASAGGACLLLVAALGRVLISSRWNEGSVPGDAAGEPLEKLGAAFLSTYLVPFETISILLLVTLIGAVVIARKEERDRAPQVLDQESLLEGGQES